MMKIVKLIALGCLGFVGVFFLVFLFRPHDPTKADFIQDYLMARAILDGRNPYSSLDVLGPEYGFNVQLPSHPSPHPPTFAVLSVPLGLFSYRTASLIWLLFCLASLLTSLHFLLKLKWAELIYAFIVLIAWYPIHTDLKVGQLMTLMLLFFTLAWLVLRAGRDVPGGVFVGLALSVKLIAWPLVIYLLLKRRFRAFVSALAVFSAANLAAALIIGYRTVLFYYSHIGGVIASYYRSDPYNFSMFSIGDRLFSGTNAIFMNLQTTPLVYSPQLAVWFSALCALVLCAVVLYATLRVPFDEAFGVLICAAIILSPVSWWFYYAPLLVAMKIAWDSGRLFSKIACVTALVAPYIPRLTQAALGTSLTFWPGLFMLAPLFGVVLLVMHYSDKGSIGSPYSPPQSKASLPPCQ